MNEQRPDNLADDAPTGSRPGPAAARIDQPEPRRIPGEHDPRNTASGLDDDTEWGEEGANAALPPLPAAGLIAAMPAWLRAAPAFVEDGAPRVTSTGFPDEEAAAGETTLAGDQNPMLAGPLPMTAGDETGALPEPEIVAALAAETRVPLASPVLLEAADLPAWLRALDAASPFPPPVAPLPDAAARPAGPGVVVELVPLLMAPRPTPGLPPTPPVTPPSPEASTARDALDPGNTSGDLAGRPLPGADEVLHTDAPVAVDETGTLAPGPVPGEPPVRSGAFATGDLTGTIHRTGEMDALMSGRGSADLAAVLPDDPGIGAESGDSRGARDDAGPLLAAASPTNRELHWPSADDLVAAVEPAAHSPLDTADPNAERSGPGAGTIAAPVDRDTNPPATANPWRALAAVLIVFAVLLAVVWVAWQFR